ncbi:MAG TPA: tRNA (adenosine(37)-N6)-threonylcarbamoyltransferase complex ATPase subunit type 1 TsaE [Gammaproteobacteria bacterium]|jgi:tRNA threonylcarbamoyladenosine biosynthesis protein TsaE|nr:tRNA (adenosine(37)-N6)-threonylcarbamoyltransferase complex ATPase subunit type 1 TsaE [Gammaproteobacteria bacterium]
MRLGLKDAAATEAAGAALGKVLPAGDLVIYLHGDLGAGKTTLVRGMIRSLGHPGRVPSPTYTLVEPYELGRLSLKHLDLYRIADPEELAFLGVREMQGTVLIEWPERGAHFLPNPDLECRLTVAAPGRVLEAEGRSEAGRALLAAWDATNREAGL